MIQNLTIVKSLITNDLVSLIQKEENIIFLVTKRDTAFTQYLSSSDNIYLSFSIIFH